MAVLAVVPARAGSRGLPGKNLAVVGGHTLVERAIRTALGTDGIAEVVVSSDDERVLAIARELGVTAEPRPPELAQDDTPSVDVVTHVLAARPAYDAVVLLQPTSPLRTPDDVVRCLAALQAGAPAAVTVTRLDHPLAWSLALRDDGSLEPEYGWEALRRRRQELPAAVRPNGACYAATRGFLAATRGFVGPGCVGVLMPKERSVDVDDGFDLTLAQVLAERV